MPNSDEKIASALAQSRAAARLRVAAARDTVASLFSRRMMAVLLALLVTMIFVLPVFVDSLDQARLTIDIMLTLVLIVGTLAVLGNPRMVVVLALCSGVALVLRWSEWIVPLEMLPMVRDSSVLLSLFVMSVAVGINVFGPDSEVINRLLGAIVLYLLIGLIWAVLYLLIGTARPGAFSVPVSMTTPLANWLYYSFTTLTTVGYGDIVPVSPLARSTAMLEALIGQLYPAIILARLVAGFETERKDG